MMWMTLKTFWTVLILSFPCTFNQFAQWLFFYFFIISFRIFPGIWNEPADEKNNPSIQVFQKNLKSVFLLPYLLFIIIFQGQGSYPRGPPSPYPCWSHRCCGCHSHRRPSWHRCAGRGWAWKSVSLGDPGSASLRKGCALYAVFNLSFTRVFGSGSAWIRINLICWIRIRIKIADPNTGGQKWPTKIKKNPIIFMFLSTGCSHLRAEGFSCSLGVLYGGLWIIKLQFLIKKIELKFPAINFFQF
jgi:hypothetical protein